MVYLEVCCLMCKCLEISLCISVIDSRLISFLSKTITDFISYKIVEVGFIAQDMVSLGECSFKHLE